jgi:hypothetical protein
LKRREALMEGTYSVEVQIRLSGRRAKWRTKAKTLGEWRDGEERRRRRSLGGGE